MSVSRSEKHYTNKLDYFRLSLREVQAQISFLNAQLPALEDRHRRMMVKLEVSALQERESYLKRQIKQANMALSDAGRKNYESLFREVAKRKLPAHLYEEIEQMTRTITQTTAAEAQNTF